MGLVVVATLAAACGAGADPVGAGTSSGLGSGTGSITTARTAAEEGFGQMTVAGLALPSQPGHFTGAPGRVTARLTVTSTGCVTVTVDGVTRVPFWPAGSRVVDSYEKPGAYTVTIPGGPTLRASRATGDTFAAEAVIDEEGQAFDADSKVGSFLGFCAVEAAPIAFRDASTVIRSGS